MHDWLMNLPFADPESYCKVIEVSFNNGSRKEFYRNNMLQVFEKGEMVTVEGISGFDVGELTLSGEMVRLQMKKKGADEFNPEMKRVLRRATDKDIELLVQNKAREKEAVVRARAITRQLKLNMKMSEVEIQADGRKATFYYIADDRVDFRELIKILAAEFKVKVEMRQIGARQEAGKVGGIGSCGRELCCSTWLTEFKSVNTTAARYQNLSINQTKLSGQCGRLKCCLNYELDTYLDALQHFPENADTIQVARGTAILIKKDIFRNLMWYVLQESSKHYPLTIERVKKIKQLNAQGIFPEELEAVEVTTGKPKEVEPEFVDVVGQISLRTLEKSDRKKRQGNTGNNNNRDNRDNRDNRPNNERDRRPASPQNQQRPSRDSKEPREARGARDSRETREPREVRDQKDTRNPRDNRDQRPPDRPKRNQDGQRDAKKPEDGRKTEDGRRAEDDRSPVA
ncbi:MAG TPA: regulatory iron-sulfur-containing complex subunit RicT [Chitinophagaceae bacterium]|nr:regulatory iron-sulfur-containing complex subunit RicT [Chitinophagaceae bacterium]